MTRVNTQSRFIAWCSEWKSHTTIRGLVETSLDKASRKFKPEDTIRYIDISSVDGESNSVIGTTEYRFSEAPSRAQQCTRKGDILVSTVRPNLKNIAVNQLDEDNLVASSGFCVLRPKEQYSGLILAYVLSEPFTQKMVAEAKGSNYPAIHDSDILDYPITVPESHELVRVVEFVQQADKSKFSDFKSRFIEMFGNPVTNTKKWLTEPLEIVAPESPSENRELGQVWILNLDMVESQSGRVIEKVYDCSDNLNSVSPFDKGNVLFSKLRPYLNKVVIPDGNGYATTELVPLRPNETKMKRTFLAYLLRSDDFVGFADSIATGTKMPRMPMQALRSFECILPPIQLQEEFIGVAEQADKSKYLN